MQKKVIELWYGIRDPWYPGDSKEVFAQSQPDIREDQDFALVDLFGCDCPATRLQRAEKG